jgi:hypothetical protein
VAWTVQYVVWAAALAGVLVARRRARRRMAEAGDPVLPLRAALAARRAARRTPDAPEARPATVGDRCRP